MAKELVNTLRVNGDVYKINAVQASMVENKLAAKKIELNKDDGTPNTEGIQSDFFEYNGSSVVSPVLVPATGGRFEGRITVPDATSNELEKDGQTVLNYDSTVGIVLKQLLNTSAMATWDEIKLKLNFTTNATINGLCVIKGKENGVNSFAEFNHNNKDNASSENIPDSKNTWVSDYLYLCLDTGNIYLGNAESTDVLQLATGEGNDIVPGSIYLDKTRWIIPDPNNSSTAAYATYSSSGIDMHNSDLTNVNSMWFADSIESRNEGIIFLRNESGLDKFKLADFKTKNEAGEVVKGLTIGDRLYALDGKLYFNPGVIYNSDPDNENYHSIDNSDKKSYQIFHTYLDNN